MKKILAVMGCVLLAAVGSAEQNWKAVLRYDKQAAKADLAEHLRKYAAQDSHAQPSASTTPSTKQQAAFAKNLAKELKHIGATNVQISKTGIVTAELPATINKPVAALALVAHYDTPPQARAQQPQTHNKYVSGSIVLNKEISLTEENSTQLLRAHGHDFITSNGSAAFGADSKAGLSIVMTLADYLLGHTSLQHGPIQIVLLPDSFSHAGAEALDVQALHADLAYVLDGADLGEIAAENFSGRTFTAVFEGARDIPPGRANTANFTDNLLMASDFHTLLPRHARPETTAGQQGYILVEQISTEGNLTRITGNVRAFTDTDLQNLSAQVTRAFNTVKAMYMPHAQATLTFENQFANVQAHIPPALLQTLETALRQEDISPKRISVRDNADFAVLTSRGLPAVGVFTGVFHGGESLEYADVDIMEASLRALLSTVLQMPLSPRAQ